MSVLRIIREEFERRKPLKGTVIGACMHITKETAVLMRTLRAGGADVYLCASNPLSTQDDVAAALAKSGIGVFGWRGETEEEYYLMLDEVISRDPQVVLDDGGDLIVRLHEKYPEKLSRVIGGCEETTTGVIRERALAEAGKLSFPVIAVNNSRIKLMMDNMCGTGQSALDGFMRATNLLIAGKKVVVAGYGWVGSGIAKRARGLGARVIVTEVDPVRALQAVLDGFNVLPMEKAIEEGDIFITATGNVNAIDERHILNLKDGAILANAGHFNVEVNIEALKSLSKSVRRINYCVEEYTLKNGKKVYLLGEGRLLNLVCGEGHPCDVMDTSFSLQALCTEYIKGVRLEPDVHPVPIEIENRVAELKLRSMGIQIDELTEEQREYIKRWK